MPASSYSSTISTQRHAFVQDEQQQIQQSSYSPNFSVQPQQQIQQSSYSPNFSIQPQQQIQQSSYSSTLYVTPQQPQQPQQRYALQQQPHPFAPPQQQQIHSFIHSQTEPTSTSIINNSNSDTSCFYQTPSRNNQLNDDINSSALTPQQQLNNLYKKKICFVCNQCKIIFVYVTTRVIFIHKQLPEYQLSDTQWVDKHHITAKANKLYKQNPITELQRSQSIIKCEWCFKECTGWKERELHETYPTEFCLNKRQMVNRKSAQYSMYYIYL